MSVQSEITRLATAKADIKTAIEGKGVTVPDATTLDGMAALIDAIEAGGGSDTSVEDGIITRTVTEYTNKRVTSIGSYSLSHCSNLSTVSFPLATNIGSYSFYSCSKLSTVSFPRVTSIGNNSFSSCSKLSTVSFPLVTSIGSYSFASCSNLSTVSFPLATSIGSGVFSSCSTLSTVSFPRVTNIGNNSFGYCSKLSTVSFPLVTSIGSYSFVSCSTLSTVSFPRVTSIGNNSFSSCCSLTAVILGNASQVCTLYNTNVFSNCYHILGTKNSTYNPTGAKDGYIYVPDDLVDSYKAATNWSTYAEQIKPLSEYTGGQL